GEGRAPRLAPLGAGGGEVRGRERRRRAPRDGALVEALDLLERAGEVGLHEGAVGEEDTRRLGVEHAARPLGHAREPRRAGDALAGETDRGRGERAERPRPEARGEGAPAGGRAGEGRGADA